jgi:hypothetical protein
MRITKEQIRRIIREEKSHLLNEVSMSNVDIVDDIYRWVGEMEELRLAASYGNLETPEAGGSTIDQQAELADILSSAIDSLGSAVDILQGEPKYA